MQHEELDDYHVFQKVHFFGSGTGIVFHNSYFLSVYKCESNFTRPYFSIPMLHSGWARAFDVTLIAVSSNF